MTPVLPKALVERVDQFYLAHVAIAISINLVEAGRRRRTALRTFFRLSSTVELVYEFTVLVSTKNSIPIFIVHRKNTRNFDASSSRLLVSLFAAATERTTVPSSIAGSNEADITSSRQ